MEKITRERQFLEKILTGGKTQVKKQMAAYIDTLPEFNESKIRLEGIVHMPIVREVVEPGTD